MLKHVALLTILCILLSCHNDDNSYTSLIKGDWIGPNHDTTYPKRYISFEDSTCSYSAFEEQFEYEVKNNKLWMKGLPVDNEERVYKYSIIRLTKDSLVMLLNDPKQHDTLRYYKPHPKNNITPATIYFGSGGMNKVPRMAIEIDSARNVHFYGGKNTSLLGGYSGTINQKEYNAVISYIRNLPIDSLNEYYEADITDEMLAAVSISYDSSVIFSSAYGNYKEPVELRLLLTKLMNLYQHLNLQPDSSVNEDYFAKRPMRSSKASLPKNAY
jgi:hypothetical protein